MKTKRISELSEKLPKTYRNVIFEIVDVKVESDMEKILAKFDSQFKMLFWMMGIGFTLLGILITVLKYLG